MPCDDRPLRAMLRPVPEMTDTPDDERRFQEALRLEVLAIERVRCLALA